LFISPNNDFFLSFQLRPAAIHVLSCRTLLAEGPFQSEASQCGMCEGQIGILTVLFQEYWFPPSSNIPLILHIHYFIHESPTLCNR